MKKLTISSPWIHSNSNTYNNVDNDRPVSLPFISLIGFHMRRKRLMNLRTRQNVPISKTETHSPSNDLAKMRSFEILTFSGTVTVNSLVDRKVATNCCIVYFIYEVIFIDVFISCWEHYRKWNKKDHNVCIAYKDFKTSLFMSSVFYSRRKTHLYLIHRFYKNPFCKNH